MIELLFHDQDRTRRVLDNSFGSAAHQETFKTGATVGADDNQIGPDLFGGIDDFIVGGPENPPSGWASSPVATICSIANTSSAFASRF